MAIKIPQPPAPSWVGQHDRDAEREGADIAADLLDKDARTRDHGRNQNLKDHVHWATRAVLWTGAGSLILMGCVFVFHLVSPETMHFITGDAFSTLKGMVGGALASGIFSQWSRKTLQLPERPADQNGQL